MKKSIYVSICLSLHLFLSLSLWLFTYLSICPSIYVSIHLSIYLSICLSISLSIYLSIDLSIYLSFRLSILTWKCASCHNSVHFFEIRVLLTVWLPNVLRATTACTFSRSELPKVVWNPSVFNSLTSKCASRHNGVHFFEIWTSKSGPNP